MSNQTGSHSYYMSFLMYFTRVQIIKIHTKCIHKMMSVSFNGIQYWTKIKEFFKTSFQCMLSRFRHVQLFVTPMDPPSSSVHGILQARILEWAAMPSSRGSSPPRDRSRVSCIAGGFFTSEHLLFLVCLWGLAPSSHFMKMESYTVWPLVTGSPS